MVLKRKLTQGLRCRQVHSPDRSSPDQGLSVSLPTCLPPARQLRQPEESAQNHPTFSGPGTRSSAHGLGQEPRRILGLARAKAPRRQGRKKRKLSVFAALRLCASFSGCSVA